MKLFIISLFLVGMLVNSFFIPYAHSMSDNEFAEFEDPDEMPSPSKVPNQQIHEKKDKVISDKRESNPVHIADNNKMDDSGEDNAQENLDSNANEDTQPKSPEQDDDATVETEEEEDTNLYQDNEEFEGFETDRSNNRKDQKHDIKIAKVPHHLTSSWDNYFLEIILLSGLVIYFLAFLVGKSKNQRLANAWLNAHKDLLETNFSIVGDDGVNAPNTGTLRKEAEHIYSLWCSGRVCVEGMLVELKLLKRQDLISVISHLFKPASDYINFMVRMEAAEMDGFVMAISNKKKVASLLKDYHDLAFFCPDKKIPPRSGIPDNFVMLSEIGEATMAVLDNIVCKVLEDYEDVIEYIHISDQYSGFKPTTDDANTTTAPKMDKVIVLSVKVGRRGTTNSADMEALRPIVKFLMYLVERVRKVKLGKEARLKSEKNRRKAVESYQKQLHSQRQEAAQQRREEKRRIEKEKLLAEEDPDKARKMEERENKKDAKRKQPKTKMLKVKGM